MVYGGHQHIVARISGPTLDALAAFEAEGEDREVETESDPLNTEEGVDHEDREPDEADGAFL